MQIPKKILEPFGVTGMPTPIDAFVGDDLADHIGKELEDMFRNLALSDTTNIVWVEDILEQKALETGATTADCQTVPILDSHYKGNHFTVHYHVAGEKRPYIKLLTKKVKSEPISHPPVKVW